MRFPPPFLIAYLLSFVFVPLAGYSVLYSLLVTEVVPTDQIDLPIPSIGDKVSVYGVWVQDTELMEIGVGGWYEIHPVRYVEVNGTPSGEIPYSKGLMEGVWSPSRLIVLDKQDPYRIANGTVAEVFVMPDGDYHVHINVEEQHVHLLRPNIFATSMPLYQILKALAFMPIGVTIVYLAISLAKPEKTILGRALAKRKRGRRKDMGTI